MLLKEKLENKCTCDVCMGRGKVTYKGYELNCLKCHGKKEIVLDSKTVEIYTVEDKLYHIVSYRYTVCKDGEVLRYKLKWQEDHFSKYVEKNATEEEIFANKKEADAYCDQMNNGVEFFENTPTAKSDIIKVLEQGGMS